MRVAIANATSYALREGSMLLAPDEWKSLKLWIDIFDEVTLLKPLASKSKSTEGWLPIPAKVQVMKLCDEGEPILRKRIATLKAAEEALRGHDLLYARMPNWEASWCDLVAARIGIPLLLEIHGDPISAIREETSSTIARKLTRFARMLYARRTLRRMGSRATCAVTIGPVLAKQYIPTKVPTLVSTNHLLESSEFRLPDHNRESDGHELLFVGCLQRRKGLHILFESLRSLHLAGYAFHLTIVGDGDQRNSLHQFAECNGFIEKICFTGQIPHGPKLFERYQSADIFILPSIAAEGVPRVTHEAMAFGCPVIATDIGSVTWQLSDDSGIVVPPNDSNALADAIAKVLTDSTLHHQLSVAGFTRSKEFTYELQARKIRDFITRHLKHTR